MKVAFLYPFFISFCFGLAISIPNAFKEPSDIKKIVIKCDQDKNGELSTEEFANCAEKDVKALDINGDARVERHEIKQMVKLSTPEADRQRAEYLAEIGKFKDMVRDCSRDRSVSSGQISIEEGMECLRKFPQHKDVFEECDENKDGKLVKEEMKNHITRVRDRMGVNYQQPPATTPMS